MSIRQFLCSARLLMAANLAAGLSASDLVQRFDGRDTAFYGQVNVTGFPDCARANCIDSDQLSPSHLGCIEPELTTDCLCMTASTPLACAPSGPSDQDNCWYYLEDWFAGICDGSVATIQPNTMPRCMQNCLLDYLNDAGCMAHTRNCFCILPSQQVVDAASSCLSRNCVKKMQSTFQPASWHDDTCKLGHASNYDQASYDKYVKMVRSTRIGVSVVIVLLYCIAVVFALFCIFDDDDPKEGGLFIGLATVVLLVVLVPIYTAL